MHPTMVYSSAFEQFPISRIPGANVSSVPQRSLLRYPGGKTWLIPHIREWLSRAQSRTLVEPFAGGGIVSLTAVMEELVNEAVMIEIDPDVSALWKTALLDTQSLIEKIRLFTPTRIGVEELEGAKFQSDAERAFRTLVLNRTKRAGILAKGASFLDSGEDARGIGSRWYPETLVKRLQEIGKHAENISFQEGDSMQILEPLLQRLGQKAAVFVDPPYTGKGGKGAGSRLYTHFKIDHARLFEILDRNDANFLMTYDGAQEIVDLIHQHGFHAVRVEMKNAHYRPLSELIITRENLFT